MSIKDKLQIILITYNRAEHVRNTINQFFFDGSPVIDCEFLVQDNNSTDNTYEVVSEFAQKYPNVKYVKNKYNLGISGTIARAMERAEKEYVWIIGDDDKFDFSNWNEVEQAINNNEKMICIADYVFPTQEDKTNPAWQLFQLTFITGGIYHTSLFNDVTIRNAYDNIYTLFPHIPPIIAHLNDGGKIYVVNKAISDNGMDLTTTDCSYTRGVKDTSHLYKRTSMMSWVLGYANIISLLKDKKLQEECMEVSIPYKDIHGNWENFYNCMYSQYINQNKINYFLEIYDCLSDKHKRIFDLKNHFIQTNIIREQNLFLKEGITKLLSRPTFLQQIFSIRNENSHKVLRILGIKMKFRRKNANKR